VDTGEPHLLEALMVARDFGKEQKLPARRIQ
jgi:hypothetical protein